MRENEPHQSENPETQEEQKEKIIEEAQEGRVKLLAKTLSAAVDFIPTVGAPKMLFEAALGKTVDGRKLTPLGRLNHVLVQVINGYAWWSIAQGKFLKGGGLHALGSGLSVAQYAPEAFVDMKKFFSKNGKPEMADRIERMKEVTEKSRYHRLFFEPNGE